MVRGRIPRTMHIPSGDMTAADLRRNMMPTYFTLRIGIVVLSRLRCR